MKVIEIKSKLSCIEQLTSHMWHNEVTFNFNIFFQLVSNLTLKNSQKIVNYFIDS
jgi:hypothetical protein